MCCGVCLVFRRRLGKRLLPLPWSHVRIFREVTSCGAASEAPLGTDSGKTDVAMLTSSGPSPLEWIGFIPCLGFDRLPCFGIPTRAVFPPPVQAYGYDDHGISELWMQNYMGEGSAAQDAASQRGFGQLSDEAIRSQVCRLVLPWRLPLRAPSPGGASPRVEAVGGVL